MLIEEGQFVESEQNRKIAYDFRISGIALEIFHFGTIAVYQILILAKFT